LRLKIFDVNGCLVRTRIDEAQAPGSREELLDSRPRSE
jgi:hypothetical protein